MTQITNTTKIMWDISIDSMNIKKIIKEYIRNSMPINLITYMEKKNLKDTICQN